MAMIIAFSASTSSGSSATAIVIAAITAYSRPVSQASQKPDSKCHRFFSPSIAAASQPPVGPSSSPAHRPAPAIVHGSAAPWPDQSGPADLRFLKRLGKQTHLRAIKPNRLGPVRSFRTEYVERATEWISASVPHQGHQAGRTLTEVDRHARHINL